MGIPPSGRRWGVYAFGPRGKRRRRGPAEGDYIEAAAGRLDMGTNAVGGKPGAVGFLGGLDYGAGMLMIFIWVGRWRVARGEARGSKTCGVFRSEIMTS